MSETDKSDAPAVKTAQDILAMTGKDDIKFGVLISLIKIGEISNKEVVNVVLDLVSGWFGKTFNQALVVLRSFIQLFYVLVFPPVFLLTLVVTLSIRIRQCITFSQAGKSVVTYVLITLYD